MSMFNKATAKIGRIWKSISTNDPFLSQFFGASRGQVSQPYANIVPVYQSVKAIGDNISQAPMIVVSNDEDETPATNDQATKILALFNNVLDQTGTRLTYTEFMQWISSYQALKGESFLKKGVETQGQRSGTQLPSELVLISPYNVSVQESTNNEGHKVVTAWTVNGKNIPFTDMIQVKDFNPYDTVRGTDPMQVVRDQLRIETFGSETQAATLENDATPGLLLTTEKTLTPTQRTTIRASWEARHKGSNKSGKMALAEGGVKAERLGFSNTDMQFVDMMKQVDQKIIGIWRVPKAIFSMTDDINYATFLGQLKVFWTMTLIPILNKFENSFNKEIVQPFSGNKLKIKFDLSNIEALQDNIEEFATSIQTLTGPGLFTRNEVNDRFKLGFDENSSWGDTNYINFSQIPAGTEPITTTEPIKTVKKKELEVVDGREYTKAQISFLKGFNNIHDKLHVRFNSALRKYFNGLRKRVLVAFDDSSQGFAKTVNKQVEININWLAEAEQMGIDIEPHEREAIEQGVGVGERATSLPSSDRLQYNVTSATVQRTNFAAREATQTTKDQINKTINDAIDAGDSVTAVKDKIKHYFNQTDNRATTIARTEITAQLNGGLLLQYDDVGVTHKEWLTNIDGFERDTHAMANHQVRRVSEPFNIGATTLMFPGDYTSDLGEIINCRCSVLPVLEGE